MNEKEGVPLYPFNVNIGATSTIPRGWGATCPDQVVPGASEDRKMTSRSTVTNRLAPWAGEEVRGAEEPGGSSRPHQLVAAE